MTAPGRPPLPSPRVAALRAALEVSRAALLDAIGTLAERDFASSRPSGKTVVATLATLAPRERDAIHVARAAIGAPERHRLGGGEAANARALPPQVVHDLAGARYETLLFIDSVRADQLDAPAGEGTVEAVLAAYFQASKAVPAAQPKQPAT
jgi:hypothetical protein